MVTLRNSSLAFAILAVVAPLCLLVMAEVGTHQADLAMDHKACGLGILAAYMVGLMFSVASSAVAVTLALISRRKRRASRNPVSVGITMAMALGPAWFVISGFAAGCILRLIWGQ